MKHISKQQRVLTIITLESSALKTIKESFDNVRAKSNLAFYNV